MKKILSCILLVSLLLCATSCGKKHKHSFSSTLSSDATSHYYLCSCGEKKDVAPHVYTDDADATCDVCGYVRTVAEPKEELPPFDYLTEDLSAWVSLPDAVIHSPAVTVTIDGVNDGDVENEILKLLYSHRGDALDDAQKQVGEALGRKLGAGDDLSIFYHGYQIGEDGEILPFSGGSNLTDQPFTLGLGSGSFIAGFELALVGSDPKAYRVTKVTAGAPTENDTAFIRYTKKPAGGESVTVACERVALAENPDAIYGEGFLTALLSLSCGTAGSVTTTDGTEYTNLTILWYAPGTVSPLTIPCYFPYNYGSEDLAGKHVFFDVYLCDYTAYDAPTFDDAFITDTLGVTAAELSDFAGDTLADKYRTKIRAGLDAAYVSSLASLTKSALMALYTENAVISGDYPASAIAMAKKALRPSFDNYVNQYVQMYAQYGYSLTYNEMVMNMLGLSDPSQIEAAIDAELAHEAPSLLRQDFALFYALQTLDLLPDAETYEALYGERIAEEVADYVAYYGVTEESAGGAEAYAALIDRIRTLLNEDYGYDIMKSVCLDHAYPALAELVAVTVVDPKND